MVRNLWFFLFSLFFLFQTNLELGSQTHGYKSVYFSFRGSSWATRCSSDSVYAGLLDVMLFILQSDESDLFNLFGWMWMSGPTRLFFLPLHWMRFCGLRVTSHLRFKTINILFNDDVVSCGMASYSLFRRDWRISEAAGRPMADRYIATPVEHLSICLHKR